MKLRSKIENLVKNRKFVQKLKMQGLKKCVFSGPNQNSSREPQDIYPVNGIAFHPKHTGLLATVGSDGKYTFWDKVGQLNTERNNRRKMV